VARRFKTCLLAGRYGPAAGVYIVRRRVAKTFAVNNVSSWGTWPSEKRTAVAHSVHVFASESMAPAALFFLAYFLPRFAGFFAPTVSLTTAWAAARRAIGTRNGEQET